MNLYYNIFQLKLFHNILKQNMLKFPNFLTNIILNWQINNIFIGLNNGFSPIYCQAII